jgi:N-acetylglucosamine-6-phosphate deacetylase
MATLTPANSLNLYDVGEIAVNKKADIVLFDKNIDVSCVIIEGEVMFGG